MAKSVYAQHALHQSFLDMQCMKGGNIRAFLENLELRRNELTAAGVTVTDAEFECTVLRGIPDWLAAYTSQLLGTTILNGKSHAMPDIIHILSGEADHVKTRNASKEQPQTKGKKVAQTLDEALAATGTSEGNNARHRKGKCHRLWQGRPLGARMSHQEEGGSHSCSSSKLEWAVSTGKLRHQVREQACRLC